MAINNVQYENLKTLFTNDSQNIEKAKIAFKDLSAIKTEYDAFLPAKVKKIKIVDVDGKEYSPDPSIFNLANIVSKVKDDLEAKYNTLFKTVSDLLIKKTQTNGATK